ncbi:MAG: hypothetical protein ACRYFS_08115 [Janthinobacterium lividum]
MPETPEAGKTRKTGALLSKNPRPEWIVGVCPECQSELVQNTRFVHNEHTDADEALPGRRPYLYYRQCWNAIGPPAKTTCGYRVEMGEVGFEDGCFVKPEAFPKALWSEEVIKAKAAVVAACKTVLELQETCTGLEKECFQSYHRDELEKAKESKIMWIASTAGWFSIVQHRELPDTFMVRARVQGDLENIKQLCSLPQPIITTPKADYPVRLIVSGAEKTAIIAALADGIDYPNFKSEVAELPDQKAKLPAYHDVWEVMSSVEDPKARLV